MTHRKTVSAKVENRVHAILKTLTPTSKEDRAKRRREMAINVCMKQMVMKS